MYYLRGTGLFLAIVFALYNTKEVMSKATYDSYFAKPERAGGTFVKSGGGGDISFAAPGVKRKTY